MVMYTIFVFVFALEDESIDVDMIDRVVCHLDERYTDYRMRLELAQCMEWPFKLGT